MAVRLAPTRGVGWAIRKVRLGQKRTLEDLAAAVGTDAANLSRIERGNQWISEKTLYAIAHELGLSVADLWRVAEHGEDDYAKIVAKIGLLPAGARSELLRFAEFLLSQHRQG